MTTFSWRPHTEKPKGKGPMPALIVARDPEDSGTPPYFLLGIYFWRDGAWLKEGNEDQDLPAVFWWVPEVELLPGPGVERAA